MTVKYYYQRANYYFKKALDNPGLTVNYLRLGHERISRLQVGRVARHLGRPESESLLYYLAPALPARLFDATFVINAPEFTDRP